jgi:hypothetical protein
MSVSKMLLMVYMRSVMPVSEGRLRTFSREKEYTMPTTIKSFGDELQNS